MDELRYISIDLKSFYASVECVDRALNPLTTNLVVADESKTEKTICLAVSPSLKAYGISGRARLFEVVQRVKEVNYARKRTFQGNLKEASYDDTVLKNDSSVAVGYLVAPPRMARYIEVSKQIYNIYTQFVSPEDIHVYSIDEVFIDAAPYLKSYKLSARELAVKMIRAVYEQTGIIATAGIGSNLYLCKVAMDIVAKHVRPDETGVRIAQLDEAAYRKTLWEHRPITDFWRVGKGYAENLEKKGIYTMGDVARCSVENEEILYNLFGVNAELLIDHSWGWEPCTIAHIKNYRPQSNSVGAGQVLQSAYNYEKGIVIVKEMADKLALELVEKNLVCNQIVLTVGYDIENLTNPVIKSRYHGEVVTDRYGRKIPKHAHGSENLKEYTSSGKLITQALCAIYERVVEKYLLIRRVYLVANHVLDCREIPPKSPEQLDLFTDYDAKELTQEARQKELDREHSVQSTVVAIHKKFGKNALVKGMNLEEGATSIERNGQIGGHKK